MLMVIDLDFHTICILLKLCGQLRDLFVFRTEITLKNFARIYSGKEPFIHSGSANIKPWG